jgi:bifunctional non-homologous end joining protein LigD
MASSSRVKVEVEDRVLELSNLDKVLYPQTGFTKGAVIDYYTRIASWLLPHLEHRPISLKRYPDGVEGFYFFEKQCPSHRPDWLCTATVASRRREGKIDYCVINDLPSLVWAANLADLELHSFLHRAPAIQRPTMLAFDLDPGPPATLKECCRVGLRIRDFFTELDLQCFAKTSGSKGLQVYVPLNTPTTYDRTKNFARELALRMESEHPDLVVSKMAKNLRAGKIFVDWSQNDEHKTTICVYSLRAKSKPSISTPLTWEEVKSGASKNGAAKLQFGPDEVLKRAEKSGDLFAPVLKLKQKLPRLAHA